MPDLLYVASALLLLAALHPYLTYPLSLWLLARLGVGAPQAQPAAAGAPLRFAICTCAYNEEDCIGAKVENLLALRREDPRLEILIYVDAASDRTAQILAAYADRLTLLHVSAERRGKTYGMNLLVAQARADIVVFTDANVMLDAGILPKLRAHFADPSVGCVCGCLTYTNAQASVTAGCGSLYWRLEERIKRLEGRTGSIMGSDGSLFAIRRSLHEPPPEHLIDDMYVSFAILCGGFRLVQATDVRAFEESVPSQREEFRRKARIACQGLNVHRLIWPRLRRLDALTVYKYVSHKLLRWLTIYLLAGALLAALAGAVLAGQAQVALTVAAGCAAALLLGHLTGLMPLAQIADVLVAFAGAGLGVWQSLRGEQHKVWAPAKSIRNSRTPGA